MPRLRFSIRQLMVAVAVVALALGSYLWVHEMRTRSYAYALRAAEYENRTLRDGSGFQFPNGRRVGISENENTWIEDAWAHRMADRYWHLATYPWLPVEPDLPPPKLLAHPRTAYHMMVAKEPLPKEGDPGYYQYNRSPPSRWTFLWTSPRF